MALALGHHMVAHPTAPGDQAVHTAAPAVHTMVQGGAHLTALHTSEVLALLELVAPCGAVWEVMVAGTPEVGKANGMGLACSGHGPAVLAAWGREPASPPGCSVEEPNLVHNLANTPRVRANACGKPGRLLGLETTRPIRRTASSCRRSGACQQETVFGDNWAAWATPGRVPWRACEIAWNVCAKQARPCDS